MNLGERVNRRGAHAALAIVAALVCLWPLVLLNPSGGTPDVDYAVRDATFEATYTVADSGELFASENIGVVFNDSRRGIFRLWRKDVANDPTMRDTPHDITVARDGAPDGLEVSTSQGGLLTVARIGDPMTPLPANERHVYTIDYTLDRAISATDAVAREVAGMGIDLREYSGAAFYRHVVPDQMQFGFDTVDVTVELPADVDEVWCGVNGAISQACTTEQVSPKTIRVTTQDLPPLTPVTVLAVMEDQPAPALSSRTWRAAWDNVLGESWAALATSILAALAAAVLGAWLARRSREQAPGMPLMYEAPKDLGPAVASYVATEEHGVNDLVATLLYLADEGAITISTEQHGNIVLTACDPGVLGHIDGASARVATNLGLDQPGAVFEIDHDYETGRIVNTAVELLRRDVEVYATGGGYMTSDRRTAGLRGLGTIAFIIYGLMLLIVPQTGSAFGALAALPFALFGIGALPAFAAHRRTRRTEKGREAWSRTGGLYRTLATDSAIDRFAFSANKNLYIAFIPWAVAFGVASQWAAKYQAVMNQPLPQPEWFIGDGTYASDFFTLSVIDYLASGVANSVANWDAHVRGIEQAKVAAAVSQFASSVSSFSSSGGGGFGGGGFGSGAGGGGGGGSW